MTTTPITAARLQEIAADWRSYDSGRGDWEEACTDCAGHVPELLAEIERLQGESHDDAGRMLQQYRVNAKLIEAGKHALLVIANRDARIAALESGLRDVLDNWDLSARSRLEKLLADGGNIKEPNDPT